VTINRKPDTIIPLNYDFRAHPERVTAKRFPIQGSGDPEWYTASEDEIIIPPTSCGECEKKADLLQITFFCQTIRCI
jgi:hypothetical protein